MNNIKLKNISQPQKDWSGKNITLTEETIHLRVNKVIAGMKKINLKQLLVYADVEHGSNFEYLVGFVPRFEEAILLIDISGEMTLFLGNENLNKAGKARIEAKGVQVSLFSLPDQHQRSDFTLAQLFKENGVSSDGKLGLVGWKKFTSTIENNQQMFDIPAFIVDAIKSINSNVVNAAEIFIGENGVRNINNANEVAYFEYGAALASDSMLDALNKIEVGVKEIEVADCLTRYGQYNSVVTIMAAGERFKKANMYPTNNTLKVGDPVSITVGYRGGLSSRAGYIANNETDLPSGANDYVNRVAAPYFNAYSHWLEEIKIGMTGNTLYNKIETILPKEKYGWHLCPGHLVGYDEWQNSPVYDNSLEVLQSGMMLQVDIIPSVNGYAGVSAESTVVLADDNLKTEIKNEYPEMWERIQVRIKYLKEVLGINLSNDILPMCSTVAYLRPFMLNHGLAFIKEEKQL